MVVMELTEKEICNQAIMVQDACNISGVLNSYYEIEEYKKENYEGSDDQL